MISWPDIKELQKQKLNLQVQLNELLNSKDVSKDSINELRSEIKHLDTQITKILGSNEIKRQEELKEKRSGKNEKNKERFYSLKEKYKKISKIRIATSKMIAVIENYNKNINNEVMLEETVKQKVM